MPISQRFKSINSPPQRVTEKIKYNFEHAMIDARIFRGEKIRVILLVTQNKKFIGNQ